MRQLDCTGVVCLCGMERYLFQPHCHAEGRYPKTNCQSNLRALQPCSKRGRGACHVLVGADLEEDERPCMQRLLDGFLLRCCETVMRTSVVPPKAIIGSSSGMSAGRASTGLVSVSPSYRPTGSSGLAARHYWPAKAEQKRPAKADTGDAPCESANKITTTDDGCLIIKLATSWDSKCDEEVSTPVRL